MNNEIQLPEITQYLKRSGEREHMPLPDLEQLPSALRETAEHLIKLTGRFNPVEMYTATNIGEEKSRFIASLETNEIVNPKFTYPQDGIDTDVVRLELANLRRQVREIYQNAQEQATKFAALALILKIKDDMATCDMLDGITSENEEQIASAFRTKYGTVGPDLVAVAQTRLEALIAGRQDAKLEEVTPLLNDEEQKALKKMELTPEQIKEALEWGLRALGILASDENPNGFRVLIDPNVTSIDVRDKSRSGVPTVYIPTAESRQGEPVTGAKLLALLEHEIGAHARQSINGFKLFGVGGGSLKIDNEGLYEGLAKRNDDAFYREFYGTSAGEPIPYYVLAIADAQSGMSFREVFDQQLDYRLHVELKLPLGISLPETIDPQVITKTRNLAWGTTYRVFRGHTDTSNAAAYANGKDAAYFQGWLMDKQLQAAGHGHVNEVAIMGSGGLKMMAQVDILQEAIPHQYKPLARIYWETVMKDQVAALLANGNMQ